MRLNRRKPEEPTSDLILQLGSNKIQVPPEKFTGRIDEDLLAQAYEQNRNDQDKVIDTIRRMRPDPAASSHTGQFYPWSPDDLFTTHPHQHQRSNSAHNPSSLAPPQYPADWDRRPSNNLPEPYDPSQKPPTNCPATPNLADMPLRSKPGTFDGRVSPPDELRSRESTTGKRARKLRHLFPERSASALLASTSSRARSGIGGSGKARRNPPDFAEDVVQATKTNVRRPPKGIQNWFDGFISDDDDEDDEDDDDEDDEELGVATMQSLMAARPSIPPAQPQAELTELPADDVAPPAYSHLARGDSRASHWSNRSYTPGDDNPPPFNSGDVKAPIHRTQSVSTTGDSLRSSHSQNTRNDSEGQISRSRMTSESVLALSDHSTSEHDVGNHRRLPSLRDSIGDNQSVRIEDASRMDVRRYGAPHHMPNGRAYSSDEVTSAPRGSIAPSHVSDPMYTHGNQSHYDLRAINPQNPNSVALHRLNGGRGFNMSDSRVSTSSSNRTFELDNRTIQASDSISNVPSDASHIMAVTDAERMMLDLMRRRHAAMQQMSFTEGYHLALRREHMNPIRRSASADSLAQEIVDQKEHPADLTSHEIMRQKLSLLQKQDVDGALKMARFLGMQSSSQEDFAWSRDSGMAATQPRNSSQCSDAYSPLHQERDSAYLTWSPQSPYHHGMEYHSKQPQYAESVNMSPTSGPVRRISTQQHVAPSPVPEEEPIPSESEKEQDRGRQQATSPPVKRVSRSMDAAAPVVRTTGLHHRATFDTLSTTAASPTNNSTTSPLSSIITAASHVPRRQAGADTPDSEASHHNILSKKMSKKGLPHARGRDSGYNPRASSITNNSATEDVLAGWAELGGRR